MKTYLFFTLGLFSFAIWGLGSARMPLTLAFIAAYLSFPVIHRIEKWGLSRRLAVPFVFAAVAGLITLGVILVVPPLASDLRDFIQELPALAETGVTRLQIFLEKRNVALGLDIPRLLRLLQIKIQQFSLSTLQSAYAILGHVFSGAFSIVLWVANLFLIPVFFFFIITRFESFREQLLFFAPPQYRFFLRRIMVRSERILSGYIRGQLFVCLILAALYATGLSIVGLRFGALIGLGAGLLSLMPYVGFSLGLTTALLVAVSSANGVGLIVGVLIVFAIVQATEGLILTPRIVGNQVGLSILGTMLVLIIGGNALGLLGMLVAIPVAAILKEIFLSLRTRLQETEGVP